MPPFFRKQFYGLQDDHATTRLMSRTVDPSIGPNNLAQYILSHGWVIAPYSDRVCGEILFCSPALVLGGGFTPCHPFRQERRRKNEHGPCSCARMTRINIKRTAKRSLFLCPPLRPWPPEEDGTWRDPLAGLGRAAGKRRRTTCPTARPKPKAAAARPSRQLSDARSLHSHAPDCSSWTGGKPAVSAPELIGLAWPSGGCDSDTSAMRYDG